jgi:hypothetical protein
MRWLAIGFSLLLCVVGFSACLAVCQSDPQKNLPSATGDCTVHGTKDGVAVGLQPIENREDQEKYFGTDLGRRGVVPIFVIIENQSTSDVFILQRSEIRYGTFSSGSSEGVMTLHASGGTALVASAFLPFAGSFLIDRYKHQYHEIVEKLVRNELQTRTVPAGASIHGFLYLPAEKNARRSGAILQIPLKMTGTDRTTLIELSF